MKQFMRELCAAVLIVALSATSTAAAIGPAAAAATAPPRYHAHGFSEIAFPVSAGVATHSPTPRNLAIQSTATFWHPQIPAAVAEPDPDPAVAQSDNTQPEQPTDLNGTWQDAAGRAIPITQSGSQVKLTLGNTEFVGELTGGQIQLTHTFSSISDLPARYKGLPADVQTQLVGTTASINGPVSADFSSINASLVTDLVKYNDQTHIITERTPENAAMPLKLIPLQYVIQYQHGTVTVHGNNLSATASAISFSDPSIHLLEVVEATDSEVTIRVRADEKASADPIDVTVGGYTAKSVFAVHRIEGALWLVEALQPSVDDLSLHNWDFKVSLRLFTRKGKDPDTLIPLQSANIAFGFTDSQAGQITAVGHTLSDLDAQSTDWLTTDASGRVFCRVHSDLSRGSPVIEARFGEPDTEVTSRRTQPAPHLVRASLQNPQPQPGANNQQAFNQLSGQGKAAPPANGNLVNRNFEKGQGYLLDVASPASAETLAQDDSQLKKLLFKGMVNAGVAIDPYYKLLRFCVGQIKDQVQSNAAPPPDLSIFGGAGDIGKFIQAQSAFDTRLNAALQDAASGSADDIAKAIYGGLLYGGAKGLLNAGFDQTIGNVYYLGEWIENYVAWAKDHPSEAVKNYLELSLWLNPLTAPTMVAIKIVKTVGPALVAGVKWLFNLKSDDPDEAKDQVAKTEPSAFQQFFEKTFSYLTQGTNGSDVAQQLLRGVTSALEVAPQLIDATSNMLPELGKSIAWAADAIDIQSGNHSVFKWMTCGYFVGLGAGYVIGFIGTEIVIGLATEGIGTYVQGTAYLSKIWSGLKTAKELVDLGNMLMMVSQVASFVEALENGKPPDGGLLMPYRTNQPILLAWNGDARTNFEFTPLLSGFAPAPPPAIGFTKKGANLLLSVLKFVIDMQGEEERLLAVVKNLLTDANNLRRAHAGRILLDLAKQKEGATIEVLASVLKKAEIERLSTWSDALHGLLYPTNATKQASQVLERLAQTETAAQKVNNALEAALRVSEGKNAAQAFDGLYHSAEDLASKLGKGTDGSQVVEFLNVVAEQESFLNSSAAAEQGLTPLFPDGVRPDAARIATYEMDRLPAGAAATYDGVLGAIAADTTNPSSYLADLVQQLQMSTRKLKVAGKEADAYTRAFIKTQLQEVRTNLRCVLSRTSAENEAARELFDTMRPDLIKEWSAKTGLPWPTDAKGLNFQAHHVIPLKGGGVNAWYNIVPLQEAEHLAGAHSLAGPLADALPEALSAANVNGSAAGTRTLLQLFR